MICTHIQRLNASAAMKVATAIAVSQIGTSNAPVIMAINLTVMDKHVKVCRFIMRDDYCSYKFSNTVYYFNFSLIVMHYKLQISMSVLQALKKCVIPVQLATTLKGVTHALATLDTQAMAFFA